MTLILQPIRVATGFDEEGMMVLDEEGRLVAVLTHLSDQYDGLSGIGIWKQSSVCWRDWIAPHTLIWR